MRNSRVVVAMAVVASLAWAAGAAGGAAPATAPAGEEADWPQFRGPTRDGIAPPGPKLLDTWPKGGPRLLWKSVPLWPPTGGVPGNGHLAHSGCGSITIAGGRAFIFANFRRDPETVRKVVLTTKDLNDLGWMEGVPSNLAEKVEQERTKGKAARLKPGPELDAYARQYVEGLDPDLSKKFGPWVERRLRRQMPQGSEPLNRLFDAGGGAELRGDPVFEWEYLEKLAAVRDKEFPTMAALDTELGGALNPWKGGSNNAIRVLLTNRSFIYFDSMICLDAATGKEIWRKEWPGRVSPHAGGANVGASSTPAVWDGKVYFAGSAGMYCLSVTDGTVIWQAKTGFSNSSPLVMNGIVYVMVPAATAYDARTGQVLWCQPPLSHADSSFTTWASGGKTYLITGVEGGVYSTPGGGVYCLDPADGKVLWSTFCPGRSLPVLTGADTLVMLSSHSNTTAFRLTPAKAEKLWETKKTGDARGESPLIYQDHVYISGGCHSDNPLRCLDLKTGELKWNPRKMSSAEASSPVLVDGKIIALLENDEISLYVVMYRATPEKYEELGRFNPVTGPGASPSISAGKLYLRLKDCVACYDLTGPVQEAVASTQPTTPAPAPPGTSPAPIPPAEPTPGTPSIKAAPTSQAGPAADAAIRGWRGDGTGHFAVAMPPTEWGEKTNVKWRTAVDSSHSTPVACGSRVFVTSERCTLTCLDRTSGQVLWKRTSRPEDVPAEFQGSVKVGLDKSYAAGQASSTPVCDGESVFVNYGSGAVSCYDLDGTRKWFRLVKPVGLNYGHSASPLLADGKLVVYLDGLTALDAQTGRTIWENKAVKRAYGCPVLMTLGQTKVVITPTGFVTRLSDGKVLARDIAEGLGGDEFSISPLVQGDVVYYIDSTCTAVRLTMEGEAVRVRTLWTAELPEAAVGSPAFHDGLIFACTKTAHYSVLDAATGKPVLVDPKSGKLLDDCILDMAPAGGNSKELTTASVYPSVTVAGKCVYVSNDMGQTFVLEASKTFKEIQRNRLPKGSGASLFFDGPDVFLRSGDYVYRVGP